MKKLGNYISLLTETLKYIESDESKIEKIANYINTCSKKKLKVLVAGNGGSCADAEHFVGELVCTFNKRDRKPISAINLAAGNSALTAWSNDFGFETFFERLTMAHGQKGDCILFISTGGGNFKNKASLFYQFDKYSKVSKKTRHESIFSCWKRWWIFIQKFRYFYKSQK